MRTNRGTRTIISFISCRYSIKFHVQSPVNNTHVPHMLPCRVASQYIPFSGNRGEGRSVLGSTRRLMYPAARRSNYRHSGSHRPSYSQQAGRHPVYRAQERYQPSEVGYKPKKPSSQPDLRPPSSPSSFMQYTGSGPSQTSVSIQPDKPKTTPLADSSMPIPNSGLSEEYDTPPPGLRTDAEQEPPSIESNLDQNLPSKGSSDDFYHHPAPSKYPHYHSTNEKPFHDNSQDYIYVDYDPNSHEHKPDTHDHIHYYNSYHHLSPPDITYQPQQANDTYLPVPITYGPEENRNKKPYTYYYIGRKLWFIPLYFSVYFIVYIASLLVKSIARHKIKYPVNYWAGYDKRALGNGLNKLELELTTEEVTKALAIAEHRYA